jgi:hypothetical protein
MITRNAATIRITRNGTMMMTAMITTRTSVMISGMIGMMDRSAASIMSIGDGIMMTGTGTISIGATIRGIVGMMIRSAAMIMIIIGGTIRIEKEMLTSEMETFGLRNTRNWEWFDERHKTLLY